jgi:hypothetical protein
MDKQNRPNRKEDNVAPNRRHREVECTSMVDNKRTIYYSIYQASKSLKIVHASVGRCCRGIQHTAISKLDGNRYSFKFCVPT